MKRQTNHQSMKDGIATFVLCRAMHIKSAKDAITLKGATDMIDH
jgi:hypothetical protein